MRTRTTVTLSEDGLRAHRVTVGCWRVHKTNFCASKSVLAAMNSVLLDFWTIATNAIAPLGCYHREHVYRFLWILGSSVKPEARPMWFLKSARVVLWYWNGEFQTDQFTRWLDTQYDFSASECPMNSRCSYGPNWYRIFQGLVLFSVWNSFPQVSIPAAVYLTTKKKNCINS